MPPSDAYHGSHDELYAGLGDGTIRRAPVIHRIFKKAGVAGSTKDH